MADDSERDVDVAAELRQDEELPRTGIDRLRPDEEIYQGAENIRAEYEVAEDGMPKPKTPTNMPFAPPLSPDTFICMADCSKFVLRDGWGNFIVEFEPDLVDRAPNGRWRVQRSHVTAAMELLASEEHKAAAEDYLRDFKDWVEVFPMRPACRHYARQMSDFQDDDEHAFITRLCSARRDDGGEFLSLRDAQLFGCDMREPPEPLGRGRLDKFDDNKVELGKERIERGEVWDVDRALDEVLEQEADQAASELTEGGIFQKG